MTNVKVFKTVPNVQKFTDCLFPARPFLLKITDKTDIFKNHKRVASRKRNQKATFLAESGFFATSKNYKQSDK